MATSKKDKNESKNLRTLFSVICLSIIALGLIVYFSSQRRQDPGGRAYFRDGDHFGRRGAKHRVEGVTETAPATTAGTTAATTRGTTTTEPASMQTVGYQYALQEFLQISGVRERAAKLQ